MLKTTFNEFERYLYDELGLDHANYYKALYNYAYDFFYERKFDETNIFAFKRYLENRKKENGEGLSRYTINNYIKALKKLGHKEGFNLDSWKLKKTHTPHISILEDEEIVRVVKRAYQYDFRRAVATELVLRHGCRIKEVIYLPWDEYYGESLYLKDTKTDKPREIQILPDLAQKIEKLRDNHPIYIFSTTKGHLNARSYNDFLKKLIHEENIKKKITAHKLRHSYATSSDGNGVSLRAIQENLGHTDIRTTQHYIHTTQKQLREAAKKSILANYKMTESDMRITLKKTLDELNRGNWYYDMSENSKRIVLVVYK